MQFFSFSTQSSEQKLKKWNSRVRPRARGQDSRHAVPEAFPPTKAPSAQERVPARVPAARPLTRRQWRPGVSAQAAGVVPTLPSSLPAPSSPAPLTAYSPDPRPGHSTE